MKTQSGAQTAREFVRWWLEKFRTPKAALAADIGLPNRNYIYSILDPACYRSQAPLSEAHFEAVATWCRSNGFRVTAKAVRSEYEAAFEVTAVAS